MADTSAETRPPREAALPLLLVALPLAVAVARTPALVGMVCAAALLLAFRAGCLRAFAAIVAGGFLLNLLVPSGFAIYSDADNYLIPNIRLLAAGGALAMDGAVSAAHFTLPQGFVGWGAALYRLTGWVDAGNCLVFLLLPAAWLTLRRTLTRAQTALLAVGPLTFVSLFCALPDGCVYLLLLTALFAHRAGDFRLSVVALVVACTFKTTAWLPAAFVGLLLLRDWPRRWGWLALAAAVTGAIVFPTLRALAGGSLSAISADFLGMDAAAREMGYWPRLAYAYLGHWLVPGDPRFNVATGGIDGGGVDGLGPVFRLAVWASLAVLALYRRRLAGWGGTLLAAWGSVLAMPTLYIGYARYAPLLYVAVMLPLVLTVRRTAVLVAVLVCAMPAAWVGWRLMLASENLTAQRHAETVRSDVYNVRCAFRGRLVAEPQPTLAGNLSYTYRGTDFPPMPRTLAVDNRLTPASDKARGMAAYALGTWLPWACRHLPTLAADWAAYRFDTFMTFPRGTYDGLPPPARQ